MNAIVYDAAILIAADRNDRRTWAEHRARIEGSITPLVPAPVVAQVSRSTNQALLRRLLSGCIVVPMDELGAHEAGRLLARSNTADVVDAAVVVVAVRHQANILTGDPRVMRRLVSASGADIAVVPV